MHWRSLALRNSLEGYRIVTCADKSFWTSSRAMSVEEKRHLGQSLGRLPPDNLSHVIQIIAQKNPSFNINSDEVEVDIDAQDPATLWRLQRYVQAVLSGSAARQATPRSQATKRNGSSLLKKNSSKRSKATTSWISHPLSVSTVPCLVLPAMDASAMNNFLFDAMLLSSVLISVVLDIREIDLWACFQSSHINFTY